MTQLTVTAKGRITLPEELLQHLGVQRGDKLEVGLAPGHEVIVRAVRPKKNIQDFFGPLAGKTDKKATLEELDEAARDGWAGLR